MAEIIRGVDGKSHVNVHLSDEDRTVHVQIGSGPDAVTFVGDLDDIHRLFVEIDRRVSGLVARTPAVSAGELVGARPIISRPSRRRPEPMHQSL